MNIYKEAVKRTLRFPYEGRELTVESLNSVPLVSNNSEKLSIDKLAQLIQLEIKNSDVKSLVTEEKKEEEVSDNDLRLLILKDIIDDRKALVRASNAERLRLQEIELIEAELIKKNNSKLEEMSPDELQARLKELKSQ